MTNFESITIKDSKKYQKVVYFLMHKGEIVYVGMSLVGMSRPFEHRDKVYDDVIIYDLSRLKDSEVRLKEETLIVKHSPKYNKTLGGRAHMSISTIKKRLQSMEVDRKYHDKRFIKKVVKSNGIDFFYYETGLFLINDDAMNLINKIYAMNELGVS